MAEPVLAIEDLTVRLSREGEASRVLDGIGLEAYPGDIIAIVGESGSGKSTLGLALQGLLPREARPEIAGSIRIAGVEIVGAGRRALRDARRHLVRAIPQDPLGALDPTMTIRRQMRESAKDREAAIVPWLSRTGLADPERIADSYPHRLSGGQRQRVLIAMAMMAKPRLLIADEPTTALDVTVQAQILDLLRELAREQETAILFITHDLGVAAALADRALVLYAGRVAEIGSMRSIIGRPAHPYTSGLLAARFDLGSDRLRPLPTLPVVRGRTNGAENACSYAPRCPLAYADCATTKPALRPSPTHPGLVACLHPERTPSLASLEMEAPWPTEGLPNRGLALRLRGVGKSFPTGERTLWGNRRPEPVLKSIDLAVELGECVALVGESGAGKSTILRIAAGILPPDTGDVFRAEILPQMVFQDPVSSLTPWLTIGEQIGDRLRPLPAAERRRRVHEGLEEVGLDPLLMDARPAELSAGQCQRAVLARAIVVPPKLLLCDEPTSSMDVALAAATLNLLGALRRRLGIALLFVTHDLAAARIIADRIAVLQDGELVEEGEPDRLLAAPQREHTRALIAAMPSLRAGQGR
jgi:peptide/nickel transport system ATP-binding protein